MIKKYAVIVAGGSGLRMGSATPKQFLLLHGKPVIWYTLKTFLDAYEDLELILVLPAEHIENGKEVIDDLEKSRSSGAFRRIQLTAGGLTRFHSVQKGLQLISQLPGEDSIIFVHDGVRCLLSTSLIHLCFDHAVQFGSAIPVIDSKDSVRVITKEGNEAIERGLVKLVQTPQTFRSSVLLPAFQMEFQEKFTDEASVVEAINYKVHLVEGEINNIKITTPADLLIAGALLI